ncbi:MAG: aldehyde dehydrogenase family protein, partial [Candidatus Acidiferrales bacterium]
MPPKVYRNFINGEWVDARCGEAFENHNPADATDLIGLFAKSDKCDLDEAVAAAKTAYCSWRLVPAPRRAEILYKAAQMLVERKEELARDMTREMGKVLAETRGDVQEAIDMTYYMAGEGRRQYGQTSPSELPNKVAMTIRQPLGICAMVTPWNFPMAIPSWKIMPALILGNTVVFKPASDTPLSAYNLVQILMEAGVPRGVVNIVTGSGSQVGNPMIQHSEVKLVSFTGSTEIGRAVSEACAPHFKPCQLEMGGKNAITVLDDANLDLAVDGAIWGGFGTTG